MKRKLTLAKETLRQLSGREIAMARGGDPPDGGNIDTLGICMYSDHCMTPRCPP